MVFELLFERPMGPHTKYKTNDYIMLHKICIPTSETELLYKNDKTRSLQYIFEKINGSNIERWRAFAVRQNTPIPDLTFRKTVAGVTYFSKVLHDEDFRLHNDIWIAYIVPLLTKNDERCYDGHDKMSQIKLFLSVITTSAALVSTHMGISRTIEEAQHLENGAHRPGKYMSVGLHAFAAQCTNSIYPEKIYMITIPNQYMRDILVRCLDKSILHVGDNRLCEYVKTATAQKGREDGSSSTPLLPRPNMCDFSAFREVLKTNPPIIWRDERRIVIDNELIIDKLDTVYNWLFCDMFTPEGDHPAGYAPYVVIRIQDLKNVPMMDP